MEMNRFRTALTGFHRGDVADYIERSAREHQAELGRLKDECANLTAQRDAAKAELEEVKARLEAALEGKELPAEPQGDPAQLELEAYRRAEAAERSTMARVRRQTEKMDAILDGAAARFDTAGADVRELCQKLKTVLEELQGTFADTTAEMNKLKETTEE